MNREYVNFENIFEEFMKEEVDRKKSNAKNIRKKGKDVTCNLEIGFEESVIGMDDEDGYIKKSVEYIKRIKCN